MSRIRDGRSSVKGELRDGRQRGWFHIDNATLDTYLPIIGMTAWGVYTYLVRRANKQDQCFPSYTTIATDCGIGRSTVIRAIGKLEEVGLLAIERRFDEAGDATSHRYTILEGGINLRPPSLEMTPPSGIKLIPPVVSKRDPNNTHVNKTQIEEEKSETSSRDLALVTLWQTALDRVTLSPTIQQQVHTMEPHSWTAGVLTLQAPAYLARRRSLADELLRLLVPVAPVHLREVRIVNGQ